jgi:hypothetical protein
MTILIIGSLLPGLGPMLIVRKRGHLERHPAQA